MAELIKDMPMHVYQDMITHISKSMIKELDDCPARFKYKYIDNIPEKTTPQLRLGSAVHTLALEPEKFDEEYHEVPLTYFNDKGKENNWRDDLRMSVVQEEYIKAGYEIVKEKGSSPKSKPMDKSKIILKKDEKDLASNMAEALIKDPIAHELLSGAGFVESTIVWEKEHTDSITGKKYTIKKKCRPDKMRNDGVIVDIKTTSSLQPEIWARNCFNLGYHFSAALTMEGYEALNGHPPDDYIFIFIETQPPHMVQCFSSQELIDEMVGLTYAEFGKIKLDSLFDYFAWCKITNKWPRYSEIIAPMKIPSWEIQKFIKQGV